MSLDGVHKFSRINSIQEMIYVHSIRESFIKKGDIIIILQLLERCKVSINHEYP